MCVSRRVEVDSASDAPSHARRAIRAELDELLTDAPGLAETVDDLELLVSELVSNAVKATAAPVTLGLQVHHQWLGLTVHDDDPGKPVILDPEPGDVHGRGLRIVSVLAQDWGVRPDPAGGGKTVWARLPLPAGATSALTCEHPTNLEQPARSGP